MNPWRDMPPISYNSHQAPGIDDARFFEELKEAFQGRLRPKWYRYGGFFGISLNFTGLQSTY